MSDVLLYRFNHHSVMGANWIARVSDQVNYLRDFTLSGWLRNSVGRVDEAINEIKVYSLNATTISFNRAFSQQALVGNSAPMFAAPIEHDQEVWATGVTYERSREARQHETHVTTDIYDQVYNAKRPELFFKAVGRSVVGQSWHVGIRRDASWSVPEPEIGIVLNPAMEVVGFTIGNDMSSRDIEGENPLYLTQAKVYTASCALGPGILLVNQQEMLESTVYMRIQRDGAAVFEGEIHSSQMRRPLADMIEYLGRSNQFPNGVILLTGTGIIPPNDFTLEAGDVITITVEPIGTLTNTVKVV